MAVDAKADIALRLHLRKQIGKVTLAAACYRGKQHQLGALGHGQHRIHHLADGLRLQRQIVFGAVRRASAGKQQAQVVVDFGDRADGGARVVAGGFLLDRNRR